MGSPGTATYARSLALSLKAGTLPGRAESLLLITAAAASLRAESTLVDVELPPGGTCTVVGDLHSLRFHVDGRTLSY